VQGQEGFRLDGVEAIMLRISALPAAVISILGLTALALAADDPMLKQAQGLFQPVPAQSPAMKGVTVTPAMVEELGQQYFVAGP
jgi:hypothetical protein